MFGTTMHVRVLGVTNTELPLTSSLPTALGHDKAQNIIDQITQAYESGGGPPPGGFGFTPASLGAPLPGNYGMALLPVKRCVAL